MTHLHKRSKRLSRDLSRFAGKLSEGVSEKAVHRLRTTIRRMETLLKHAVNKAGKKQRKALDELHALRKRAGKVRDLDIQIGLLSSIGNGSASADRRVLTEALKKRRAKQVDRLAAAAKELAGSKLLSRLARITDDFSAEQPDALQLEQVRQQISRLAEEYSSRLVLKPARLHELRIKLKQLRYQSELATKTVEQKELVEQLKSVQDCIGEWHDWEMLADSAEKQFGNRLNCALLVEIRSLVAAKYSAANSAGTNLLAAYSPATPKKPSSVQPLLAFAQHA